MNYVRRFFQDTYWRVWLLTVVPTGAIFLLAAVIVRTAGRRRLEELMPGAEAVFDTTFTGAYILTGFLVGMAVATALSSGFMTRWLHPFRAVIRVTREMAGGNFGVRASSDLSSGRDYQELVANVNALAESLERTERLRRELVSNLAHEIRTPLTNLQGYLEALKDGVIEANPEALTSVHEEVLRMVRLVDALHQLARADALRRQPIERVPVDLDTMAEQLVRVMRVSSDAKRVRVFIDAGARRMPVPVHADSIAQVMRNLLRNAVQYVDEGGSIRVQSSGVDGIYRFAVLNTGPGISPEDLPLIFNRFYRSEGARKGTKTGVGIGLAIAKELIEAHGGRIGAQSKAGWTMVWFDLPMDTSARLEPEEPGIRV